MTNRPNCRRPDACTARTPGKHCSACTLSALHRDPAFRAKRAAAFARRMAEDPEFKARHNAASAERLEAWRKTEDGKAFYRAHYAANLADSNLPANIMRRAAPIRETRLGWCPADRRDEYLVLRRKTGAAEARRMIEASIAAAERARVAALSPLDRQLERLRAGAQLVATPDLRRTDHDFTLGGVASGML